MINTTLFEVNFYIYAVTLGVAIYALVTRKIPAEKLTFWLFLLAFVFHTLALLVRWGEAGNVEVTAFEEAENRVLAGWEWFHVWISHPPWSNLYESLVCFGWGVSLVSLYGIRKFKIPVLPVFAISLSLITMGAASLLINQDISPLVPALQSKWIHLHVTMATICYPAFGLAAILGLFYLLKEDVRNEAFGLFVATSNILILLAVGGKNLLTEGQYGLHLLARHAGKLYNLTYAANDTQGNELVKSAAVFFPVPGAGLLMLVGLVLSVLALVIYSFALYGKENRFGTFSWLPMGGAFLAIVAIIVALLVASSGSTASSITDNTVRALIENAHLASDGSTLVSTYQLHGSAPYVVSISGNPFEFLLLVTALLGVVLYLAIEWKRDWLVAQLPDTDRLDELSYKTIMFAFPFLTMLIVTGAIWAYYAWGRYWGWDPKETWSLITWIVYSIYLHVRITHGWEGKLPAALAVLGFVVVIFTYLGVNILISGLHSYASM